MRIKRLTGKGTAQGVDAVKCDHFFQKVGVAVVAVFADFIADVLARTLLPQQEIRDTGLEN